MRLRACVGVPIVVTLAVACSDGRSGGGGDGGAGGDGGVDAGADASLEVHLPAPPDIPWLDPETGEATLTPAPPAITPCPDGWREALGACDPWPESGPADCPDGQWHFPGEEGCTAIGPACPTGDFADGLPDDGTVLFVRGGESGGDGSRASPFGTIAEALAAVEAGETIALAKGTFAEAVELPAFVTLRGACATGTVLTTSDPDAGAVVWADDGAGTVRDLTVSDAAVPGFVAVGVELDVSNVIVSGNLAVGFVVSTGANLTLASAVVRATRSRESDGLFGRAVLVQDAATAEVSRTIVEANREVAVVVVNAGSALAMSDSVIRDSEPNGNGARGWGLWAADGGRAELTAVELAGNRDVAVVSESNGEAVLVQSIVRDTRGRFPDDELGRGLVVYEGSRARVARSLLERNRSSAALAEGAGAELVFEDVIVRETLPSDADGTFGRGVEVVEGGRAELRRARFEHNRADAVFVFGATTVAEDVVVADTESQPGEGDGRGLLVGTGSTFEGARLVLERNAGAGVAVIGAGTAASFEDLVVRETEDRGTGDDVSGLGLDVRDGAVVTVSRAVFEDDDVLGAAAAGPGAALSLTDVVVRRTRSRAGNGALGLGTAAVSGASLSLTRALVTANRGAGVYAQGEGTTLALEDVRVEDQESNPITGTMGEGLTVTEGARADVLRAAFERNRELSVAVTRGASATLEHVTVLDSREAACGDRCTRGGYGVGVAAYLDASVELRGFRIDQAALCGVQVALGAALDLSEGEISNTAIGACVHIEDYDVTRLTTGVRFRNNGTNVEAVDFAVAEPEVSLAGL